MKNRRKSAVFLWESAPVGIQALGSQMDSGALWSGAPCRAFAALGSPIGAENVGGMWARGRRGDSAADSRRAVDDEDSRGRGKGLTADGPKSPHSLPAEGGRCCHDDERARGHAGEITHSTSACCSATAPASDRGAVRRDGCAS